MSKIKSVWTDTYYIPTYEVDFKGNVTLPMLGRFMQETASHHAEHLGVGHEAMVAEGRVWMLLGLAFRIHRYPLWRDTILVSTWPSLHERFYYFRDFEITCHDEVIGEASSKWIPVDIEWRRPFRGQLHFHINWDEVKQVWPDCLQKLPEVKSDKVISEARVRYTDLDVNEHVNNIRYMEWILDGFSLDFHRSHQLHEFEIHFQSETLYGDLIELRQDEDDGTHFVHSLIRKSDHKEICRARSAWQEIEP